MLLTKFLKKASDLGFVLKNRTYLVLFLYFILGGLNAFSQKEHEPKDENLVGLSSLDFKNLQSKDYQILVERATRADTQLLVQKRNFQIYLLLGVTLILGLIAYVFISQNKMRIIQFRKESELRAALITIDNQNKLQEQRLRMSKDLNDSIARQLNTIISSINNLKYSVDIKDKKLRAKLSAVIDFTSTTFHDFKDAIWAMNVEQITLKDLRLKILNFVDRIELYRSNIRFLFHINGHENTHLNFTAFEGLNLIKVIEASINNSMAHAKPTTIEVQISRALNNTVIKIIDNGKGFDLSTVKRGNGLNAMEKYMQSIGGCLEINTSYSEGTEIILVI